VRQKGKPQYKKRVKKKGGHIEQETPAAAGVVLANEAAANRKGCVVIACRSLIIDDNGASWAAALSANHVPAIVFHPLRESLRNRIMRNSNKREAALSQGLEPM
jgi:hypothetical protein